MAPARILASQPQHQGPHLGRRWRTSALAGRLPPLPADEPAMPAQQRPRADQRAERKERGRWQAAAASRARSVARSLGRATSRRSTSSSWRTTRSSMSLTSRPRDCGRAPPAEPETRGRGRRRPHRRSSQPSPRRGRDTTIDALQVRTVGSVPQLSSSAGNFVAGSHNARRARSKRSGDVGARGETGTDCWIHACCSDFGCRRRPTLRRGSRPAAS
jgi:hypothetical protein